MASPTANPQRGRDAVAQALTEIRGRASDLRSLALEPPARALEWAAGLVELAIKSDADRLVSPAEAAALTGYNPGHISRLVRTGRIPDRRPPGSRSPIVIRVGDLPQKPGHTHTPDADVRDLASRLRKRG